MLLKTKKGTSETKLKRTQNELELSAQMREIEPKFELIDIAHVGPGNWTVGDAPGTEIARLGETRGTARECKNSGNKAKNWLKTKHITFLKDSNQAPLAPIGANQALKGAMNTAIWENKAPASQGEGEQGQFVG